MPTPIITVFIDILCHKVDGKIFLLEFSFRFVIQLNERLSKQTNS